MIGATVLPLSIAGIGMREGVFVFFLGPMAAIYAFAGYLVGEIISLFGGPVWLARKGDYYEVLKAQRDAINKGVEDDDEDDEEDGEQIEPIAPELLPSITKYATTGLGAGLVAGLGVAIVDAARLWMIGGGADWSLPGYAALFYGPLLAVLGALSGAVLAALGRFVQRPAAPAIKTATFVGLALMWVFVVVIGFFFLQRDVFGEKAGLFAPRMLGSLVGLMAGTLVFCLGLGWALRKVFSGARERFCKPWVGAAIYVVVAGALAAAWGAAGGAESAPELGPAPVDPGSLPNVVLVMNDTHRADYTGVFGERDDLTPNLDRVAADGVAYENAWAQASWTRPSVATILTGRYPSSHTATLKGSVLPDEVTTLAETMLGGGYETIGIATNYNLTPFFKFNQGFVDYRYMEPDQPLGSNDAQAKLIGIEVLKKIKARFRGKEERPEDYYVTGDVVTEMALKRIDERDKGRPFFTFLSYMDVHDPYFRHPFDGYGISHRANPNPDPSLTAEMKELYAGEVKYWDEQLGELIDGLKQRGIYDETLIVVVSDHGEEFGEHGGFWHGTTLYEEQLRVVFVVKYPDSAGVAGGTRIDAWMRLLDVAPLIIDAAGLEIPDEMQGAPAPESARTPVFAQEDHQGNVLTSILFADEDGAQVKLIRANQGNPRGVEPLELYRLDQDSQELKNLAEQEGERLSKATEALDASEVVARQGAVEAEGSELSAEQKAMLIQLGYMKENE
ncbi:MAG: sulfatase, partial [Deltaproteobacteria bacterium]|nr:sulfatase [Deltaproteobacteria bacterium]